MASGNIYETEQSLAQYLLFHFGGQGEQLPWSFGPTEALDYPVRTVSELIDPSKLSAESRALDLGCAVGRSAFELARHCTEVIGIDYSHHFVAAAETIRREGCRAYQYPIEGALTADGLAQRPEGIDPARLTFRQGDAMKLDEALGSFDVVHMANLIDRLTHPMRCLERLPSLVKPGGQLLLASPFTWLEEFTSSNQWLGGYQEDETSRRTAKELERLLHPAFRLEYHTDIPFIIREHVRKYQWSVGYCARYIRTETP